MEYQNVKGTHDIILEEAKYYQAIESLFISMAETYNFNEFRTPIIEPTSLFNRSKNESSDMVRKQMYTFNDLAGREISLRPEGTASVARCIVNNKLYAEQDFPIKAYYLGPVFRYERPKAGTYRQFLQFGVESIGINNIYSDVEIISLSYRSLFALGFKNIKLKINTLGDEESRNNYKKALVEYFTPLIDKMCPDCKERLKLNPLRILDCKVAEDKEIIKDAPRIKDYLNKESLDRFNNTLKLLDSLSIPYEVDDGIVRGLDYYSHVVFEFEYISLSGLNVGALGGGGHYDNLISEVNGPALSGVGFAFGIERIYSLLKSDNILPQIDNGLDFYIMPVGDDSFTFSSQINEFLRMLGFKTDMCIESKSFKNMFKKALKKNSKFAIIIGEEEIKNKVVVIKDLTTQEQVKVPVKELKDYCDNLFMQDSCSCHCHDHENADHECHCHDHNEDEHECCCHHHNK